MDQSEYDFKKAVGRRVDEMAVNHRDELYQHVLKTLTKGQPQAAEDIVQDTFMYAQLFLSNHPNKHIHNPLGWLKKIAYHRFLNINRRPIETKTTSLEQFSARRTSEGDVFTVEFEGRSEDEPEHVVEAIEDEQEENDTKKKAIIAMAVDEKAKQIVLDILKGLGYEDIAYRRGMTVAQVKNYANASFSETKRK